MTNLSNAMAEAMKAATVEAAGILASKREARDLDFIESEGFKNIALNRAKLANIEAVLLALETIGCKKFEAYGYEPQINLLSTIMNTTMYAGTKQSEALMTIGMKEGEVNDMIEAFGRLSYFNKDTATLNVGIPMDVEVVNNLISFFNATNGTDIDLIVESSMRKLETESHNRALNKQKKVMAALKELEEADNPQI